MPRLSARRTRRPSKFRRRVAHWIDPYPQIPGTLPEKMIFDALKRRRIYFIFQGELADLGYGNGNSTLLQDVGFQPDIVCPEYKVIYDPFGDFAHSKSSSVGSRYDVTQRINLEHIGRDAWKSVYYRSLGFEFIHPWSTDVAKYGGDWVVDQSQNIRRPVQFALNSTDLFYKMTLGYRLGKHVGAGANAQALANSKRRKPKPFTLKRR